MSLQLGLLLGYSALLVGLGLWIGRRVSGTKDFFVAGRRLGPGLIFSTMLASNIGGASTVGATGLGYRDGLSAWWWVGSAAMGSLVLALWIGPRIRTLAEKHDFRTVGDFLELRYGRSVRAVTSLLVWMGSLALPAGQLIAIATILNVVTGLPKYAGCLVGGLVVIVYFTAGGLLASAWVNMVQLAVKLAGFAIALPLALSAAGGWAAVSQVQADNLSYWNPWHGGSSGFMYLALLGPAFIVSPGLLQKIYGARDNRAVRLGVGANALGLLLYAGIPPLLGMIARLRFPDLPNQELALPMILMHGVPPIVGSLGLAAVFSAEISAADAGLFMLTTSLSQDLYKRFLNPAADDRTLLAVTRGAAVVCGAVAIAIAILSPTIIGVIGFFYALLSVSLFVPILAGLYSHRAGVPEALASIACGVSAMLSIQLTTGGRGVLGLTPALIGLGAALLGFAIVYLSGFGRGRGLSGRPNAARSEDRALPTRVRMSLFDLEGRVAAVIGGGSGIGEAVAVGAAAHGCTVVILDANETAGQAVAARIGGGATAATLDIRDKTEVESALQAVVRDHGRLDVVVCTPSINVRKPILQYADEEFDRVVAVNLKGSFNVLQAAGRIMTAQQSGSIVIFSSIRSQVVEPGQSVYAMSKAGIVQLVRAGAAEFGPFGVRVNAVAPGVVETPLTAPIKANADWYNAYANKSALKRWALAEEMVGPTLFLVSDAASFVTGTVLFADGGWTAVDGRFTPPGM